MATEKVFRLSKRTSLHDLKLDLEAIPKHKAHEVLIRIRHVALNYRDIAVATGTYPFPVKDNVVPCSDMAGEFVEVGTAVQDLTEGDKVISSIDLNTSYGAMKDWHHSLGGPYDGVLREFITLPSSALVKIPQESTLNFTDLSALVITRTTVWNAFYGNTHLKPGQTVLFLGTGGVSITGLIVAKAAGARTIITSSSDAKLKYVQKTYGADFIINYKGTPAWSREVLDITHGLGTDYVFENGGAGTIAESIKAVVYGGSIAVIGFLATCPQDRMPDVAALALAKGALIRGIMIRSKEHLENVTRFFVSKNLTFPVEKEFGFTRDEVIEAFGYVATG
ncbi:unnamed protein product [Clonostachys rhizophaga]|uniref:Enoyl reductase (ER) domain-containing protein n=1 Tax=Clonostachys rhizophaga TaxID=160324 RepID=A0A9N9VDJ6_9HYPO|nr:unnamed protein product [Clonostachys rhizophaga]